MLTVRVLIVTMLLNYKLVVVLVICFIVLVTAKPPIHFYKLSLQWPPAVCNSGSMACGTPIPYVLTIHGIWPQDANDVPIPPYNAATNPCYSMPPIKSLTVLKNTAFNLILSNLISKWPDLKNPTQPGYIFWESEWLKHGTCSDYPYNPLDYFNSALTLRQGLTNPATGLTPGNIYTVQDVIKIIQRHTKASPEIACNRNKTGGLQLWEIRLCYARPASSSQMITKIQNCPHKLPFKNGKTASPCKLTDSVVIPI